MQNELLSCAIRASLLAGKDILRIYNDPKADFAIERKADESPLTIADKQAHARIMTVLEPTDIPRLSEEGKLTDYNTRKEWKTLWIVDPLDGTKEFIKRNGEFTVNIALVENGTPVLGVIYVPASRTLYFSEDSIGAYRITNIDARSAGLSPDDLMEQADRLPLEQADTKGFVVVASRSHLSPETENYIQQLEHEYGHVSLITCGSSLKICRVAEGTADIY
ncbi:MAG: 3'(2'),5'-bisphosphate nucleotidase CysQ, partial [Paraprevotella sp.]|nr:3'(2'),5'-bisphosphate nucleotidase CysQ [Paraprevotella sp.]